MYPNITVGSRFFFFSSLREHPDEKAKNLATNVDSILNQNFPIKDDKSGEEAIEQALNFLEQMYIKEASIEKQYFNEKILNNDIIKNNSKYLSLANKCFSEDKIDYYLFMTLLKLIESETDGNDYKERLTQIKQEINIFQEQVSLWTEKHNKTIDDFPSPNFIISRLFKELEYDKKRQQSAVHSALSKTKTINNAILGSHLSKNMTTLVDKVKKQIIPFLLSNQKTASLTFNQEKAFTSEISLFILEEINNEQNKTEPTVEFDTIIDNLISSTLNENSDINKSFSSRLLKYSNSILNNLTLLEEQGKRITPANERIKLENKKITGLTKDTRQKIEKIINQILENNKSESRIVDSSDKILRTKKEKEKYLQQLKHALKEIFNIKSSTRMSTEQEIRFLNELLATNSKFTMYDETEFRSARGLQNILKTAIPEVVGNSLGKTDVTLLDIGRARIIYELDDNFTQQLLSNYDQNFEKKYQEYRKKISERVYENKLFSKENSFNIMAQTEAVSEAQKQLANNITNFPDGQSLSNTDAIKELQNVFIVDNSVKHSDFVFNGKGFSGGSLGAGVIEQINNICNFYELGGITPADRDWLIFATLNCGNGLMGANLRPSLEDYFSIVASMLLFRTGGLLADQVSSEGQRYVSANNIHIFTLGPLFVPASYILLTTLNALREANNLIEREAAGSTTTIRNNVSEKDKAETTKEVDGKIVKVGQWYETYAKNYSRVSINVQLLSGFIDILNKLENIINNHF
jgi:hypothetical protein